MCPWGHGHLVNPDPVQIMQHAGGKTGMLSNEGCSADLMSGCQNELQIQISSLDDA